VVAMTQTEAKLLGLCRRLLRHNEELHGQLDRLYGIARWLCTEYRTLREQSNVEKDARAVEDEAGEVLLGTALDEALSKREPRAQE
jgi:hypothetical protein